MNPIEWKTLEYSEKDRGVDWFWAVSIIVVSIAVSSIIMENLLFAIFVIIAGIALVLQVLRKPNLITVRVDNRGIEIDKIIYLYPSLEAFWVEHLGENDFQLILKSHKILVPYVVVNIENIQVTELRAYLSEHIEEKEMHEPLAQRIMDRLGF